MIVALHSIMTRWSNVRTDIRIASETGYEAIEILGAKLVRYLDTGLRAEDLLPVLESHQIRAVSINDILGVERQGPEDREALLVEAERLSSAAEVLGCPTIQVVPLCSLEGRPWREIIDLTARNVKDIADIGKAHGVRFKVEPVAWSPIHSLSKALELIDAVERDNVGMTIDTWHLSAGEETTPGEVARLPSSLIFGVHFSDGLCHTPGTPWDENELRAFLPGDGKIPLQEWIDAVRSTGYNGVYSCELLSYRHWEWDLWDVARECGERMLRYLQ